MRRQLWIDIYRAHEKQDHHEEATRLANQALAEYDEKFDRMTPGNIN